MSVSGGGAQLRDVNRVEQHFRIWVVSKAGDENHLRHSKPIWPSCQFQTAIPSIGAICKDSHQLLRILFLFLHRNHLGISDNMEF